MYMRKKRYFLILSMGLLSVFLFINYKYEFWKINSIMGEGFLRIGKPQVYNEDYTLMLYQSDKMFYNFEKTEPKYVFSDLKKKNGLFVGIEDIVIEDFTGDGFKIFL